MAERAAQSVAAIHDEHRLDARCLDVAVRAQIQVGLLARSDLAHASGLRAKLACAPSPSHSRAAIATRKAKWDRKYQKRHGISSGKAEDLPPGLADKLDRLARRIYRALHMTGYARIDFRVRADGTPLVLEANANPNLERAEDFAEAARHDGIAYPALLQKLITLGRGYRAEWRED